MNFIITGDWHIRIKSDLPLEWQIQRYRQLFTTIIELCQEHDAKLILSGDIADRNKPSLTEMGLLIELFTTLSDAGINTKLISGNHELIGQGVSTFDHFIPLFNKINKQKHGTIHYEQDNCCNFYIPSQNMTFWLLGHPALNQGFDLPLHLFPNSLQILVSHFRPTVNQFLKEEIDVARLIEPFDIVFASDIHTDLELYDGKLIYTNHPLNNSFETKPNCGCLLVSCVDKKVHWQRLSLDLPNLVQITTTINNYREPPRESKDFYRIEVVGSPEELRQLKTETENVKLLKVPEFVESYVETEEAEEIRDQSLEDDLCVYLGTLGYEEAKIQKMMAIYREA